MPQMPFAQDQHVVKQLPAERSGETLRERVHVRSANGRPYDARADRLEEAIRTKPLRPSEVIRVGQDLCEGVAQVHIAKLVHLDIKPTNVLFDAHERATLTDFGLALQVDAEGTADVRDHALYPSFLPPEVVVRSRGAVTAAADVYQIGLTLYRAVNGEPFFSEQWERMRNPYPAGRDAIREGRFPDRTFLPGIPLGLRQVIARALQIDPALRQVGARQLAEELGKVDVRCDWEVEEYTPSAARWRLRQEGRADVLVLRQGSLPGCRCRDLDRWRGGTSAKEPGRLVNRPAHSGAAHTSLESRLSGCADLTTTAPPSSTTFTFACVAARRAMRSCRHAVQKGLSSATRADTA
jgi:serine/threonine protein kinase